MTTNKPKVTEVYLIGLGTLENMVLLSDYEALQAECEKLRKDAARYQSLLEGCDQKASEATRIATNCYGLEWDAAIDAAMQEITK